MEKLKHGSLFSGIGGFDLAAEWAGWENSFHCEWNEFGKRILKHYWPEAVSYHDITKTDFTEWRGRIDVLSGGFPCQPFSLAGKRKGTEDERHLWPHMLRAIQEIQPRYVVGENVRGILSWDGGLVFEQVQTDLEAEGYTVLAFVLPAAAVNAPHRRERVWFVAYSDKCATGSPRESGGTISQGRTNNDVQKERRESTKQRAGHGNVCRTTTDATSELQQGYESREGRTKGMETLQQKYGKTNTEQPGAVVEKGTTTDANLQRHAQQSRDALPGEPGQSGGGSSPRGFEGFPTQPPVCGGDDGLPTELDGYTFSKWRAESVKAYGNAIVPEVAFEVFKTINYMIENDIYL